MGSLKVISNVTIRYSACDFLFDFNRYCASILYRFRDTASYLSKVADFNPPHLHLAPLQGFTPGEFLADFKHKKIRVPRLSSGVVCLILSLAISVEHRLVTDRHRRTQAHTTYRASIASRSKNRWMRPRFPERKGQIFGRHRSNYPESALQK